MNFWTDKDKFDNNGYPENFEVYDNGNEKAIGKFMDEIRFFHIKECIGLKSKMYSYNSNKNNGEKKLKEINKM